MFDSVQSSPLSRQKLQFEQEIKEIKARQDTSVRVTLPKIQQQIQDIGKSVRDSVQENYTPAQKEVYQAFLQKQKELAFATKKGVAEPLRAREHKIDKVDASCKKAFQRLSKENKPSNIKASIAELRFVVRVKKELNAQQQEISNRMTTIQQRTDRLQSVATRTIEALGDIEIQKKKIDQKVNEWSKNAQTLDRKSEKELLSHISQLRYQKKLLLGLEGKIRSQGFSAVSSQEKYDLLMNHFDAFWMGDKKDKDKFPDARFIKVEEEISSLIQSGDECAKGKGVREPWYARIFKPPGTASHAVEEKFERARAATTIPVSSNMTEATWARPQTVQSRTVQKNLPPQEKLQVKADVRSFEELKHVVQFQTKELDTSQLIPILKSELARFKKTKPKTTETISQFYDLYILFGQNKELRDFAQTREVKEFQSQMEALLPPQIKLSGWFHTNKYMTTLIQLRKSKADPNSQSVKQWVSLLSESREKMKELLREYQKKSIEDLPPGTLKTQLMNEKKLLEILSQDPPRKDEFEFCQQWIENNKPPRDHLSGVDSSFTAAFGSTKLIEEGSNTTLIKQNIKMLSNLDPQNQKIYETLSNYAEEVGEIINSAHHMFYVELRDPQTNRVMTDPMGTVKVEKKELSGEEKAKAAVELSKKLEACRLKYEAFRIPEKMPTSDACISLRLRMENLIETRIPKEISTAFTSP